jgi:hypothetical protein
MRANDVNSPRTAQVRPLVACLAIAFGAEIGTAAAMAHLPITATASVGVTGESVSSSIAAPAAGMEDHPTTAFLVQNCDDAGPGSLRDAVNAANMLGVDATVQFDLNAMGCSTITLKTGEIEITVDNMTISGPDPDLVTIDGGYSFGYYNRVFDAVGSSSGMLHLDHVVLKDGKYNTPSNQQALGGCVYGSGIVYLSHAQVVGCHAVSSNMAASGGGVWARGVKLVDSVVSNNIANGQASYALGGGIGAETLGLDVRGSTISNNAAYSNAQSPDSRGGGAYVLSGMTTIQGSTISGNSAIFNGGVGSTGSIATVNSTITSNYASRDYGGIGVSGTASIYNSTIALNMSSVSTRAVGLTATSIYAVSSVFANNTISSNGNDVDVSSLDGQITGSQNLIRNPRAGTSVPMNTLSACPRLGLLLDNGGTTRTLGLLPGSPALDAGYDPFSLGTDQRGPGFDRVVGASADIGAYEWSPQAGEEINRSGFELCE